MPQSSKLFTFVSFDQLESWGVQFNHQAEMANLFRDAPILGGVDKFKPVSGCGEMDHAEEAAGQLIVSGRDGAVDFELSEHAFDAIALLVERPVIVDFHAAV